jgi:hypothetical protein
VRQAGVTRATEATVSVLDRIDTWLLCVLMMGAFIGASELGRRVARWRIRSDPRGAEDRKALSGIVLGAILGLLSLLLAFSFTIVEERFAERKRLVLEEANAIGTAYLRAELLPAPHDERARRLLERYLDNRIAVTAHTVAERIEESGRLHERLWAEAVAGSRVRPSSPIVALFVASLNDVIDVHEKRVTVSLYYRLPRPFLWTLLAVAVLALGVLGYSAGLSGSRRATIPTGAVILATALVMVLVIEMDRPWGAVFRVPPQPLVDTRHTMSAPAAPIGAASSS